MIPLMPAASPDLSSLPGADLAARLRGALLAWYAASARDLPWRRTRDPYAIWVSEVMLQQTQVATALPYYARWLARFPNLAALAAAAEHDVLQAWAGLGYYARARALLRGAREVVAQHGGVVPRTAAALRQLPGVGPYTASAVASLAYGEAEPVVDGNVERVLCRIFALPGDPKKAPLRRRLWELARHLLPPEAAGDFNSALMELGATICRPSRPECPRCPVAQDCAANTAGLQDRLPELAKRPATEAVLTAAAVIRRGDRYLLARRGPTARWAGMWQFPGGEVEATEEPRAALRRMARDTLGIDLAAGAPAARLRHSVTRYRVTLAAYHCSLAEGEPRPAGAPWAECAWATAAEFDHYALPSAHRRLARLVAGGQDREAQLDLALAD
jgi:A/G-specific adenine glycosylase